MWKSILLAVISGLLFTISWPTYGVPFFLFIAFIPLLLIEKQFSDATFKRKGLRIFLLSLLTFIVWNSLSYFWLSNAHPQENPTSEQLGQAWFAFGFAVIVNSLLMATTFLVFHKIRKNHGNFYGYLFLPVAWITLEKLHLNWDFAWPWLNLGNGFASYHECIQWYSVTGALGGTIWIIVVNIFLFLALNSYLEHRRNKIKPNLITGLALMIIPILISLLMYSSYEEKKDGTVNVVLLQPKLNPYYEKYSKSGDDILYDLFELSQSAISDSTDFIIAPETAFPGIESVNLNSADNDYYITQIKTFIENYKKLNFISGADAVKFTEAEEEPNPTAIEVGQGIWANKYNAVVQVNNVDSLEVYFKSKLVVGVELFPYMSILKPLIGEAMLDFGGSVNSLTTQEERSVFTNTENKARIAPLVCYESIFGEFTSEFVNNGANLISISTNDSWWGNTQGHKQLLAYAKLRAIENRRDVVRSANSGISAFINQRGDIVNTLDYDERGALKGTANLNNQLSTYSKTGDVLGRMALLLTGVLLAYHLMSLFMKKREN
ncbi:apolipoprotein N-acyltransferase [Weeksellaceae bacterium TAE3-ERU29]|nr:apolipoprotein N-acyltransferase [Weeksellaceae bacterium TAE3-ERU29]